MLERLYDNQTCSIARALEIVGERWTLLILRDTVYGPRRFDDLQERLGVARNVLTDRLQRMCDEGVLERRLYQERPARYEYVATQKGRELFPVLCAFIDWGDKYYAPEGPPRLLQHRACGGAVHAQLRCDRCGEELHQPDITVQPGPGAHGLALIPGR